MDSIVSCYVPEFPPDTRLRVGLTLSNRLVQWAEKKSLIQCKQDLFYFLSFFLTFNVIIIFIVIAIGWLIV